MRMELIQLALKFFSFQKKNLVADLFAYKTQTHINYFFLFLNNVEYKTLYYHQIPKNLNKLFFYFLLIDNNKAKIILF